MNICFSQCQFSVHVWLVKIQLSILQYPSSTVTLLYRFKILCRVIFCDVLFEYWEFFSFLILFILICFTKLENLCLGAVQYGDFWFVCAFFDMKYRIGDFWYPWQRFLIYIYIFFLYRMWNSLALVLLSASVERFGVSRMRDF